jgi:hypothetical protein
VFPAEVSGFKQTNANIEFCIFFLRDQYGWGAWASSLFFIFSTADSGESRSPVFRATGALQIPSATPQSRVGRGKNKKKRGCPGSLFGHDIFLICKICFPHK